MIMERKNFVRGVQRKVNELNSSQKKPTHKLTMKDDGEGNITFRVYKSRKVHRKFTVNYYKDFKNATGPMACRRMGYEAAS